MPGSWFPSDVALWLLSDACGSAQRLYSFVDEVDDYYWLLLFHYVYDNFHGYLSESTDGVWCRLCLTLKSHRVPKLIHKQSCYSKKKLVIEEEENYGNTPTSYSWSHDATSRQKSTHSIKLGLVFNIRTQKKTSDFVSLHVWLSFFLFTNLLATHRWMALKTP